MAGNMLFGRQDIYTSEKADTLESVVSIVNAAMSAHVMNSAECDYLIEYFKGMQPVLFRKKEVRNDVQHNIVLNYANYIVTDKTGYFLSSPMRYTLRTANAEKQTVFDEFKTLMITEDKASADFETAMYASICGHGFTMVANGDDNETAYISLDPRTTCCVRENKVTRKMVLGFTYYEEDTADGTFTVYDVRTASYRYEFRVRGGLNSNISAGDLVGAPLPINLPIPPIVEYKNNTFMLGDFEIVLTLLDAINVLASNSLEDIEQFVQSLLIFINCMVDEDSYAQLIAQKFAVLQGVDGQPVDAKYIAAQLNPESVKQLRQHFIEVLLFITSTPDRRDAPSGGDTGIAVKLGNGYPAQENSAKVKDMPWYKAERDIIKLSLAILHKRGKMKELVPNDISPLINRTLMETAQSNAQVQQMLLATKLYSPDDIMNIAPMTTDITQSATNGKEYWKEQWAGGATPPVEKEVVE